MTASMRNGLFVALAHVAIVASLGGKLMIDRASYPRVWARTAPVDPNLPIRGRYVRLRLEAVIGEGLELGGQETAGEAAGPGRTARQAPANVRVRLAAIDDELVALPEAGQAGLWAQARSRDDVEVAVLTTPLAFFIPPDVADPSRREAGEELWVEVTVPPRGAPRPIRLGVRENGVLTPLELR
jgi:hypothetical protein